MTQNTSPTWQSKAKEDFIDTFGALHHKRLITGIFPETIADWWISKLAQELQQARKDTEKAFGGCTNCYGKGYSTQKIGDKIYHGDFEGDKTFRTKGKIEINYCNCSRGRDLFKVIKSLT